LKKNKMPEAEVTLRLAIALIEQDYAISTVESAIDGAQVKTNTTTHFPIVKFLKELGWHSDKANSIVIRALDGFSCGTTALDIHRTVITL
jgi:hypothetical protein